MAKPPFTTADSLTLHTPRPKWGVETQALEIAVDTAKAFDELEGWITRGAGGRACWCIDKVNGKWKVGLSAMVREGDPGSHERLTAGEDRELRGAIRNAIMIAKFAGHS